MDDLSLVLRHAKRKGESKLNLSDKGIGIIPQDLYGLSFLEVLDLSNNKITSIDAKIANLPNLRFLDLSNNQIMSLPSAILKLDSLQVLNLSNNPLNMQFEILSKKENQSEPNLRTALQSCFASNSLNLDNAFPSFSEIQTNKAKSDRAFGGQTSTNSYGGGFSQSFYPSNNISSNSSNLTNKQKPKASWLMEADSDEIENKSQISTTSTTTSNDVNLKKQLQETESLLSKEQLKVIELTRELEDLRKLYSQESKYNKGNSYTSQKGGFNIDEGLTKYMEVDYKLVEIGEKISQGGFSIVYNGYLKSTPVAIKKIFNPDITQELIDELSNEITMLNRLRHPNIVLLMGICSKPPNLAIITEYLPNKSLYNLLHSSKFDIKNEMKLDWARDLALAYNYLHQSQIVHRDIKSLNVLLDENFKVKICDFGLAKEESELNKGSMKFAGTPNYMAPEMFSKKAYDKKVDVFAYGTLIWEIFQRKVPYDGLEPSDIGERVCGKDTLSMQGLHKKIASLIQECRDKDPKKRPDFESVIQTLAGIDI